MKKLSINMRLKLNMLWDVILTNDETAPTLSVYCFLMFMAILERELKVK